MDKFEKHKFKKQTPLQIILFGIVKSRLQICGHNDKGDKIARRLQTCGHNDKGDKIARRLHT